MPDRPMLTAPEAPAQEAPTAVVAPGTSKPTSTGTGLRPGVRAGPARFFRPQPIAEEEDETEEEEDGEEGDGSLHEEWTTSEEDQEETELDDDEVFRRYMAERRQ